MNGTGDANRAVNLVQYQLAITAAEAALGTKKILPRNGRRLEINVPPGSTPGSKIRLANALQLTDDRPGDIIIHIKIKDEEAPAGVITVNDRDFDYQVLKSGIPVVVDFWAPWCGPCRMIAPITEKLAKEYQGRIKFCKLNVDENRMAASRYQVMSIPMLLFFKDGKVMQQIIGAVSESVVRGKIESVI